MGTKISGLFYQYPRTLCILPVPLLTIVVSEASVISVMQNSDISWIFVTVHGSAAHLLAGTLCVRAQAA